MQKTVETKGNPVMLIMNVEPIQELVVNQLIINVIITQDVLGKDVKLILIVVAVLCR